MGLINNVDVISNILPDRWKDRIVKGNENGHSSIVVIELVIILAGVFGIAPENLGTKSSIRKMGLGPLMLIQFQTRIQRRMEVKLSLLQLSKEVAIA